ncbi:MAG: DNA polymerase III subunit beta [Chlamydiota bacterium]|jgi:DNA polymerase-3 subunit beta
MKVVISKEEIVSLIGKIQSIVASKPAIPILSNVLIEAIDGQLIVSATDLTVSMRCYIEGKVIEEGAIALPARRFFQLVREITSSQIKITTTSNEQAEITAGNSIFKIHSLPKEEFPTLPDLSSAMQVSLTASSLKELLSRSSFSAAREDSRYVLNGILLKIDNQKMTFIGTDGKRLAKIMADANIDPSFQGSYIIPLKAVEEMVKTIDDPEAEISLNLMHDKISIEKSNLTLITKLLSGQYPDVERVIPENPKMNIRLHREELITLLRQVALFTADTSSSVRFIFEQGQLTLMATSSEIGEGTVMMPADYSGERLEIAFNPYYFLDILKHSKDETIQFSIDDAFNPGKITDSTSAIFVIMPMRLNEVQAKVSQEDHAPENPAYT